MNKNRYIVFSLIVLFSVSCVETKRERLVRLVDEWMGKEIVYPPDLSFTVMGNDTNYQPRKEYTIVNYVDSAGCSSCKLHLQEWMHWLDQLDTANNVSVLFFIYPKTRAEVVNILKQNFFTYPVCIDEGDALNGLNKFPTDVGFQTFLLDKENKVVAIGNPIEKPKVKELYQEIIFGKKVAISR